MSLLPAAGVHDRQVLGAAVGLVLGAVGLRARHLAQQELTNAGGTEGGG